MLKDTLNCLLNIIYPKACLVCHKPLSNNNVDKLICINCWQGIKKNTPPFCAICGRQIRDEDIGKRACSVCQRNNYYFDHSFSPCIYEGITRELIHKFKYQDKDYLSPVLSRLLTEFIRQYKIALDIFDLVMPIPLHKIRLKEREFNQAELLAQHVSLEFRIPLSAKNLWRKHNRKSQMELNTVQRWKNIEGCFCLRDAGQVKGRNILLIDDVLTTGATCSEAASVLKSAGAINVSVLTLAN